MLPYGSLWKLDGMLQQRANPVHSRTSLNPREHRRLQRRRRIAYMMMAIMVISFFLLPYYLVHLRLTMSRLERETRGGRPARRADQGQEHSAFQAALQTIQRQLHQPNIEIPGWAEWMYFRPTDPPSTVPMNFTEGAGSLWPVVDPSGTTSFNGPQIPSPLLFAAGPSGCVAVTADCPMLPEGRPELLLSNGLTVDLADVMDAPVLQVLLFTNAVIKGHPPYSFVSCDTPIANASEAYVACVCPADSPMTMPTAKVRLRSSVGQNDTCRSTCRT